LDSTVLYWLCNLGNFLSNLLPLLSNPPSNSICRSKIYLAFSSVSLSATELAILIFKGSWYQFSSKIFTRRSENLGNSSMFLSTIELILYRESEKDAGSKFSSSAMISSSSQYWGIFGSLNPFTYFAAHRTFSGVSCPFDKSRNHSRFEKSPLNLSTDLLTSTCENYETPKGQDSSMPEDNAIEIWSHMAFPFASPEKSSNFWVRILRISRVLGLWRLNGWPSPNFLATYKAYLKSPMAIRSSTRLYFIIISIDSDFVSRGNRSISFKISRRFSKWSLVISFGSRRISLVSIP